MVFHIIIFMQEFKKIIFRSHRILLFTNAVLPRCATVSVPNAFTAEAFFSDSSDTNTLCDHAAEVAMEQDAFLLLSRCRAIPNKNSEKVPDGAPFLA